MKQLLKCCILTFLSLNNVIGLAQGFSYPELQPESKSLAEFVPEGWQIVDSVSGDLNNDKTRDYAVVLQFSDTVQIVKQENGDSDTTRSQPRILIILFRVHQNKFRLEVQSNSFILVHDNPYMDDPFNGLNISHNVLSIGFRFWYSWGSWWTSELTYKFRYQSDEFKLIGFDSSAFHRGTMETESCSVNFLTRKYKIVKGTADEGDHKETLEWKTFKLGELKTFKSLKAPLTWFLTDDITI